MTKDKGVSVQSDNNLTKWEREDNTLLMGTIVFHGAYRYGFYVIGALH